MKSFVFDAVFEAFNKYVFVFSSCKYIYPSYNGKGYGIYSFGIVEFVIAAHGVKLVILFRKLKAFAMPRHELRYAKLAAALFLQQIIRPPYPPKKLRP